MCVGGGRYLLREVYNDGKALQRPMVAKAARTAISKPSFLTQAQAPRVARRGPGAQLRESKLTTLHSTDAMSAQQAQRDLDGFWRQEDQKYGAADVRSPRAVKRAHHPVSVANRTPNPHANHHDHYRYVKPRSRDDPRTLGAKPWDYRWRRPSSAAAEPYEKYDTARKVKTQLLSARAPSAKMARARPKAEDLPPMPGSMDSLLKDVNN